MHKDKVYLLPLGLLSGREQELLRVWRNTREVSKHFRRRTPIGEAEHQSWINCTQYGFGIFLNEYVPKKLVGYCGLSHLDEDGNAIFTIYIGDPENRGVGYGSEALEKLLAYGFNVLKLHRIWSEVHEKNPALMVYLKLGFVVEGCLRSSFVHEGKRINSYIIARHAK